MLRNLGGELKRSVNSRIGSEIGIDGHWIDHGSLVFEGEIYRRFMAYEH